MSKHETWRTRAYWKDLGGLLIEEFQAVKASKDKGTAQRLIDGVIVLGEETAIHDGASYDIAGKDVVCIQTKANRLGMYLMGQAFFSRELLKAMKPASIRTVVICGKGDEVMAALCEKHDIEVVVMPESEAS